MTSKKSLFECNLAMQIKLLQDPEGLIDPQDKEAFEDREYFREFIFAEIKSANEEGYAQGRLKCLEQHKSEILTERDEEWRERIEGHISTPKELKLAKEISRTTHLIMNNVTMTLEIILENK